MPIFKQKTVYTGTDGKKEGGRFNGLYIYNTPFI